MSRSRSEYQPFDEVVKGLRKDKQASAANKGGRPPNRGRESQTKAIQVGRPVRRRRK